MPLYFTLLGALAYGAWWFVVDIAAPADLNPWASRLAVVLGIIAMWATSMCIRPLRRRGAETFVVALWCVTIHYYYLTYINHANPFWLFGLYIVVMTAAAVFPSFIATAVYGVMVITLAVLLVASHHGPLNRIFVPGLMTILAFSLLGQWRRERLLRELRKRADTIQSLYDAARASEATRVAYESAQRGLKLREQYVNIIAHELKTPLTVLQLKTDAMRMYLQREPSLVVARLPHFIDTMMGQVQRLIGIVEEILDMSRIVDGKLALQPQAINVSALAQAALTHFIETTAAAPVPVAADITPDVWVVADADRLHQAVGVLLDNAYKYGEGRPIALRVSIDAEAAVIAVRDHGMGIAPKDWERIFERFERAISERNISGLGLGLFISRSIVESLGGTIRVTSSQNEGTCFVIRLPRVTGLFA